MNRVLSKKNEHTSRRTNSRRNVIILILLFLALIFILPLFLGSIADMLLTSTGDATIIDCSFSKYSSGKRGYALFVPTYTVKISLKNKTDLDGVFKVNSSDEPIETQNISTYKFPHRKGDLISVDFSEWQLRNINFMLNGRYLGIKEAVTQVH